MKIMKIHQKIQEKSKVKEEIETAREKRKSKQICCAFNGRNVVVDIERITRTLEHCRKGRPRLLLIYSL